MNELKKETKTSIIIPCYNEKKFIRTILERVGNININKEIIVINDGSQDGTREILDSLTVSGIKVINKEKNEGKGAAIRTGISESTGDYIVIQDSDLEYDPNEIINLLEPIQNGFADVVYGSRFMGGKPHRVLYFWHYVGNKIITTMSNMFTNLNLTDVETCYKAFRREIIDKIKLEENRFGFEIEITSKFARTKCRIYEVGISYHGRSYVEGKKINWKDGVWAILCIIKYFFKK